MGYTKEYLETPIRDEELLADAKEFINLYCGLGEHSFNDDDISMLSNFKLSLKLDTLFWKILNPQDKKDRDFFYRITPFELMKNLLKSMDGMHLLTTRNITATLQKQEAKTVLDFGGGSGHLALTLHKMGYKVTYAEVNSFSIAWMEWVTNKRNLDIKVIDLFKYNINEYYDAIVIKDVMEHMKDYTELANSLSFKCKTLIALPATCTGSEDWVPMHFPMDLTGNGETLKFNVEPDVNL